MPGRSLRAPVRSGARSGHGAADRRQARRQRRPLGRACGLARCHRRRARSHRRRAGRRRAWPTRCAPASRGSASAMPSAHRMALLAMDQLAWAVAGLRQGFTVGATEAELRDALARGAVAVWAPYALIAGRGDIEESWRLTSDSLALWLGRRLGAARCYLIKSIARPKAPRLSAAPARARGRRRRGVCRHAGGDRHADASARPRRP